MLKLTVEYATQVVKQMKDLLPGEIAIVESEHYRGTLVWNNREMTGSGFGAILNERTHKISMFTSQNTMMVRVLKPGDKVTLEF
jgi:hypothetical protein